MNTFYVLVGLPASGKSTYAKKIQKDNLFVYSTDNIIEQIANDFGTTYDDVWKTFIGEASLTADRLLENAIAEGKDVLFDRTNLSVKARKRIINKARENNYNVIAIVFDMPSTVDDISEWNRRLHNRPGKTIPENVMHNMIKSYQKPTIDEGFDSLICYNIYGEMVYEDAVSKID